jgi:microcystin-dependent protein
MFAGIIQLWLMNTIPNGFLLCDGSSVLKADYPELYSVIGDIYGPALTVNHFKLPDLRGYFPRGYTGVTTVDPQAVARTNRGDGITGNNVGTIQSHSYISHTHGLPAANGGGNPAQVFQLRGSNLGGVSGAYGGSETRPKNIYVRAIIKY